MASVTPSSRDGLLLSISSRVKYQLKLVMVAVYPNSAHPQPFQLVRTFYSDPRAPTMDADDTEDTVVSLQDVLEENEQLEETANAVLGPSDDANCTYAKVSPRFTAISCV